MSEYSSLTVGFYLTFRRSLAPRLGPDWRPEFLLGVEFVLMAGLVGAQLIAGGDVYIAARQGLGGGLVGWAIASILLQNLSTLAIWFLVVGIGLLGLLLIFQYTPLRLLRLPPLSLPEQPPSASVTPTPRPAKQTTPAATRPTPPPLGPPPASPPPNPAPRKKSAPVIKVQKTPAPRPGVALAPTGGRRSKKLPPLDLLQVEDSGGSTAEQASMQARVIEDTLAGFGIPAEVEEINVGPTVTQFGVSPGTVQQGSRIMRVRVNKIVSLSDDLALALAASPIRIEAPIPGRPYVGIEVPNPETTLVSLRRLLQDRAFRQIKSPLAIPIGRDVSGSGVAADLRSLPHMLVAGATGSGKSVALNAIICALLFSNTPDTLRFLMIDPKRVELVGFNGAPHLLAPVVTEPKHADAALSWLLIQMDERYRLFAETGVRNIDAFNKKAPVNERLPYIVTIIDELADLMVTAPDTVEAKLVRLAQMARATGIHLIISTQRPSVDVVTGLIKANFPARLAFAVTSQIDSRVILDTPGAEKLLGRGDGLLMTADSAKLRRIQGCFVSDSEIQNLVAWWRQNNPLPEPDPTQPLYPWSSLLVEEGQTDVLLDQAIERLRNRQSITASGLQRLMGIGYPRAARLLEDLEAEGVIGPEGDRRRGHPVLLDENDGGYGYEDDSF